MLSFLEFLGIGSIAAAVFSAITYILKQPQVLGFLVLGVLASSILLTRVPLNLIEDTSLIGIALLLFLVGTEINIEKIKKTGKDSFILGISQVVLTAVLGFLIALWLGFSQTASLILALAFSFSSTVIVIKLLSEKNTLDSLHGRLTLGMLLIQDLIAILILIFLEAKNFNNFISAIAFFAGLFFLGYLFSPKVFNYFRKSSETSFFLSLAWVFTFIFSAKLFNLGVEIPALLAGISLANTPQALEISRRLRSVRDLFLLFFFINLGSKIFFLPNVILPSVILSAFVLAGKFLIVLFILKMLGHQNRVGFFTGINSTQISEFSLVLVILSQRLGYLGENEVAVLGLVGLITFFISTYLMTFNNRIYNFLRRIKKQKEISEDGLPLENHIILVGFHRIGYILANKFKDDNLLVIEFNPELIKILEKEKFNFIYGDVIDFDVLKKARADKAKLIISTVPDEEENLFLISTAKFYKIPVIATAVNARDALEFYNAGADYVILPHFLGGKYSAEFIKKFIENLDIEAIESMKNAHISEIKNSIKLEHY